MAEPVELVGLAIVGIGEAATALIESEAVAAAATEVAAGAVAVADATWGALVEAVVAGKGVAEVVIKAAEGEAENLLQMKPMQ